MIATYIGVALYVILYGGYSLYERFWLGRRVHFVPLHEVDLDTDAVWTPGDGARVRARDELEAKNKSLSNPETSGIVRVWKKLTEYVY